MKKYNMELRGILDVLPTGPIDAFGYPEVLFLLIIAPAAFIVSRQRPGVGPEFRLS